MIHAYTGLLGGGKTLTSVLEMLSVWRRGGYVFTNVELCPGAIKDYARRKWGVELLDEQIGTLRPEQIPLFHRHIKRGTKTMPVLVVIDETGKYFNARRWKDNELETADFLRESRKLHVDIIFITQELEYLDKQFRMLFQYIWRFTDMGGFRIPILSRYILQKQYQAETDVKVKNHWWRKDAEIFALYDTDALVSDYSIAKIDELKPLELKKTIEPKRYSMKGFIIITIAALGLMFAVGKWYFKPSHEKGAKEKTATVKTVEGRVVAAVAPATTQGTYDIRTERLRFLWGLGDTWQIKTHAETYVKNEMCSSGLVYDRRGTVILVRQPTGRTLYVCAVVVDEKEEIKPEGEQVRAAEGDAVAKAAGAAVKNALTLATVAP
jgi:hypothetical protein